MLDHIFTDAIAALRESLEHVLLERRSVEEHLTVDVLLGDVAWETSYGLPGEHTPARVQADLRLGWPTWSQSNYRAWTMGDDPAEPPTIVLTVVFRVQELQDPPDPQAVLVSLSNEPPTVGEFRLLQTGPTLETVFDSDQRILSTQHHAIEVAYEGIYELREAAMVDGSLLDADFAALGGWVSSALVSLDDLKLQFRSGSS